MIEFLPTNWTDLKGNLKLSGVNFSSGSTGQEVFSISKEFPYGSHWLVSGDDASGRTELMQLTAGLISPDSGKIEIGDKNLEDLVEATLGRTISYAGPISHIFTGTIRDNIYYGLRHRPNLIDGLSENELTDKKIREVEAKLTANIEYSTQGTWENLQVAGVDNREELADLALKILGDVGMTMDIYRIGLQSKLATKDDSSLPNRILSAREAIAPKSFRKSQIE